MSRASGEVQGYLPPDGPRIAPLALRLSGSRPGWRQRIATCPATPGPGADPGGAGPASWRTGHLSHLDTLLGRLLTGSGQAGGISQGQRVTVTRVGLSEVAGLF